MFRSMLWYSLISSWEIVGFLEEEDVDEAIEFLKEIEKMGCYQKLVSGLYRRERVPLKKA